MQILEHGQDHYHSMMDQVNNHRQWEEEELETSDMCLHDTRDIY